MSIQEVHEHIEENKDEYLKNFIKLVSQPSISAQDIGVRDCAEMLKNMLTEIGMKADIYETKGQPAVIAELSCNSENAPTLLFYGHYDVQPPEPLEKWLSPPFEPAIRDGRLYGRGAADNKGQLLTHIFAINSYLKTKGSLPINIKIILDGEEESGSPNLAEFVENNRELLTADAVYISDGPMHDHKTPSISLGNRGVMSFEVEIITATSDNHSGNKGGVIKNAAWEMVHLLSTMQDRNGNITIDGFYDQVEPVSAVQQELIDNLSFDPTEIAKTFNVFEITSNKDQFYKHLMFLPTLTINGIYSGYIGNGTKTIIPAKACAKFDIRLVMNQDGETVFEKVRAHIHKYCPQAIVTFHSQMLPSQSDPNIPVVKSILNAVRDTYGTEPVVVPMSGGSLPNYVWTRILGIPAISVPYANPDEDNHAPNENMGLTHFYKGIHASAQVIYELGK